MTVVFVVPAHGRLELARICLKQLRRTCDLLPDATAVVIADDENLETARALDFETVEHPNRPLGAKWNAGMMRAAELGAQLFVPLGSDDFIDPALVLAQLDADGEQRCSRLSAIVREDGAKLARLFIPYDGGDGVRMMPRTLLERVGFRPCDDNAERAIDTTSLYNLERSLGRQLHRTYLDVHGCQIVDFKSVTGQLNGYRDCLAFLACPEEDPWAALAEHYPRSVLDSMRALYDDGEVADTAGWGYAPEYAPLPRRGGTVASVPLDAETFTYPAELLKECESALLLFCSGRMGAADGFHVANAGLTDVTCVDWDEKTLEPFRQAYPAAWEIVQADVFEWVDWNGRPGPLGWNGRQWDIVSADAPSQYADRLPEMLPRYCEIARKYVTATLAVTGPGAPVVPPAPSGWGYRGEPVFRTEYEGRRFWWLTLERS